MAEKKTAKKPSKVANARAKAVERAQVTKDRATSVGKGDGRQLNGFVTFIRQQGVIGLAVGLAIGTAAGASVKVIVDQFINPIVALLTRGVDLVSLKWVLIDENTATGQAEVAIGWGAIIASLITLVATALVIYLFIHFAKLDRLDKKKES